MTLTWTKALINTLTNGSLIPIVNDINIWDCVSNVKDILAGFLSGPFPHPLPLLCSVSLQGDNPEARFPRLLYLLTFRKGSSNGRCWQKIGEGKRGNQGNSLPSLCFRSPKAAMGLWLCLLPNMSPVVPACSG